MSLVEDGGGFSVDPTVVRVVGYGLAAVGTVFGIIAGFWGGPPAAAGALVLAASPALVVLPWAPLFEVTSRGQRGLNPLIGAPAMAVFMVSLGADLVSYDATWISAAVGAAIGLGAGMLAAQRGGLSGPIQLTVVAAVMGALLGAATFTQGDVRFDPSTGQVIRVAVRDKHVSHGKSTTYSLDLPPWGPRTSAQSVSVSESLYDAVQPGDPVCVWLHPGALGQPWFTLHLCQPTDPA